MAASHQGAISFGFTFRELACLPFHTSLVSSSVRFPNLFLLLFFFFFVLHFANNP